MSAMECLQDHDLLAILDGATVADDWLSHLSTCSGCRSRLDAHRRESEAIHRDAGLADSCDPRQGADLCGGDQPIPLSEGSRFGKFEVRRSLGVGGQGMAALAFDPDTRRLVVLKVYSARESGRDREELLAEAQALARVTSPYVAQCYGVERDGGRLALVTEFIPGRPLSELRKERAFSPREAARIVMLLAQGLEEIHATGQIHRDIKPANAILGDDGTPRLVDFGLATPFASRDLHDRRSGTPAYMAPEQARGQGEKIGPRTDVFALGAVLYELLTGRAPFEAKTSRDALELADRCEFKPPRQLNPTIPPALEAIVLKAMSTTPEGRYSSALELAKGLQFFLIFSGWIRFLVRAAVALGTLGGFAVLLIAFMPRQPLAIESFSLHLYRGYPPKPHGEIGEERPIALEGDNIKVRARLSGPAFVLLIILNSNGKFKLSQPSDHPQDHWISYPPHDKLYGLNNDSGLQAFVIIASRNPLPPQAEWGPRIAEKWQRVDEPGDAPWYYDGSDYNYLNVLGVREKQGAPRPLKEVCSILEKLPGVEAISAMAFAVLRPIRPG